MAPGHEDVYGLAAIVGIRWRRVLHSDYDCTRVRLPVPYGLARSAQVTHSVYSFYSRNDAIVPPEACPIRDATPPWKRAARICAFVDRVEKALVTFPLVTNAHTSFAIPVRDREAFSREQRWNLAP